MKRHQILPFIISLIVWMSLGMSMQVKAQAYDPNNNPETDTIPIAPAKTDTNRIKGNIYPLYMGFSIGTNILDPILQVFGQDYGSYEVNAELNLHNRYFPEIALGIGQGSFENEQGIRYDSKPGFFYRLGFNYNFLYNSTRLDRVMVGVRYGYARYNADIRNLNFTDGYFPTTGPYDLLDQKFNSHWLEFGAGVRVQVYKWLYMGWMAYYRPFLSKGNLPNATPWYVPGHGADGSTFGFNYSVYIHFPSRNMKPDAEKLKSILK